MDGFGTPPSESEPFVTKDDGKEVFHECAFDRSITEKINPLIKVEVINKKYNLGKLLTDLGYDVTGSNMYCPFHPDEMTGKPSAKYHADTDRLYCFSENKSYSAYHAIKMLYGLDIEKVFNDIWADMSLAERHELMDKYEDGNASNIESSALPSEWIKYRDRVLDKFKQGEVSFKQYKNALYKVLMIVGQQEGGTGSE
jgi:hypothetical protein